MTSRRLSLLVSLAAVAALIGLGVLGFRHLAPAPPGAAVGLDVVRAAALDGEVASARLLDQDAVVVVEVAGALLHATYPASDAATAQLVVDLAAGGASVLIDPQLDKVVVGTLVTVVLPLVLLVALFSVVLTATREGGGGEVVSLGRLRARRAEGHERPSVRFADVAGIDDVVMELREVVDHLRDPSRLAALGGRPPTGVLLAGPPGVGKTLVAKAVAGEAGVTFFHVAGAEFVESLVGVGAARVRHLFSQVRDAAPAIVFIDEVDAVGRRRGSGGGSGGTDEREQTLNQLLVELDGFAAADGIVVLAATNRPDILDPALLRPGRFDRHVEISRPDLSARRAVLALHAAGRPLDHDVELATLAARTPGFTGADLAAVVDEAALLAVREGAQRIGQDHLREGVERVRSGPRASQLLTPAERRRIAVHEAGRAVVAAALGRAEEVTRVSAVPRGRTLSNLGAGDAALRDAVGLRDDLVQLLAGRAAELALLGSPSTLGEHELDRATALARDLVGAYALAPGAPPRRLLATGTDGHLGGAAGEVVLGAELRERLDLAVDAELVAAQRRGVELVQSAAVVVDELVAELEAAESVDGLRLAQLLAQVRRPAPSPV